MVKKSVKFGLIFFVLLIIWRWLFSSEINWLDSIGTSFAVFIVYIFIEWANKPYEWNKDKK